MRLVALPCLSPAVALRVALPVALSAPHCPLPGKRLLGIVPLPPHRVLRVLRHWSLAEASLCLASGLSNEERGVSAYCLTAAAQYLVPAGHSGGCPEPGGLYGKAPRMHGRTPLLLS